MASYRSGQDVDICKHPWFARSWDRVEGPDLTHVGGLVSRRSRRRGGPAECPAFGVGGRLEGLAHECHHDHQDRQDRQPGSSGVEEVTHGGMVPPGPGPVPGLGGRPSATVWRSRWWSPGAGPGSSRWARVWARLPGRGCGLLCLTDGEWVLFMTEASEQGAHRPGPRRAPGAPAGPDEVRRAVLDAAAPLFAERGVDAVSLRDIAAGADVHLALIEPVHR